MSKKLLWMGVKKFDTGKEEGAYFAADDVFEAVDTHEYPIRVWPGVPGDKAKELAIPSPVIFEGEEYESIDDMYFDDVGRFLDSLVGIEGQDVSGEYYGPIADMLVWDYSDKTFSNLDDWGTVKCYQYICNSNPKTIVLDTDNDYSYNEEIEIEVLDTYTLDILDENMNRYYPRKSMGYHAILEKVLADGEPALLWHEWSQYSGDELDSGYLVSKDEALETLKDHPEIDEIREWLDD